MGEIRPSGSMSGRWKRVRPAPPLDSTSHPAGEKGGGAGRMSRRSALMFGIGHTEAIVVMVVLFILFGHRLPSVMRHLGRGTAAFRDPWADRARFRQEPKTVGPMSLVEWLVILVLVAILVALFLPAWVWTN